MLSAKNKYSHWGVSAGALIVKDPTKVATVAMNAPGDNLRTRTQFKIHNVYSKGEIDKEMFLKLSKLVGSKDKTDWKLANNILDARL